MSCKLSNNEWLVRNREGEETNKVNKVGMVVVSFRYNIIFILRLNSPNLQATGSWSR